MKHISAKESIRRIVEDGCRMRVSLVAVGIYLGILKVIFHTLCPFVLLTGVACPGCGLTRACIDILTGCLIEAWNLNATAFLWVSFLMYCFIMRYFLNQKIRHWSVLLTVICLITIVYYVYRLISGQLPVV